MASDDDDDDDEASGGESPCSEDSGTDEGKKLTETNAARTTISAEEEERKHSPATAAVAPKPPLSDQGDSESDSKPAGTEPSLPPAKRAGRKRMRTTETGEEQRVSHQQRWDEMVSACSFPGISAAHDRGGTLTDATLSITVRTFEGTPRLMHFHCVSWMMASLFSIMFPSLEL
jgi:hypothetical protein